jgi:hypothetical protein
MQMETQSTLLRGSGTELVTVAELIKYEAPPPQGRWYPVSHIDVYIKAMDTMRDFGFDVRREQLTVAKEGKRFFGTLDLASTLADGVTLSVGIRNSVDKSFPIGFVAGSRVLVCDNLSFYGDLLVTRKHTKHGALRFGIDIGEAVSRLSQFQEEESKRIAVMRNEHVTDMKAESLIVRAMDQDIITSQDIPKVLTEWRVPGFKEFEDRTLWSLFNAFTSALKPKSNANPQRYASLTMKLSAHLLPQETTLALAS